MEITSKGKPTGNAESAAGSFAGGNVTAHVKKFNKQCFYECIFGGWNKV